MRADPPPNAVDAMFVLKVTVPNQATDHQDRDDLDAGRGPHPAWIQRFMTRSGSPSPYSSTLIRMPRDGRDPSSRAHIAPLLCFPARLAVDLHPAQDSASRHPTIGIGRAPGQHRALAIAGHIRGCEHRVTIAGAWSSPTKSGDGWRAVRGLTDPSAPPRDGAVRVVCTTPLTVRTDFRSTA